MKINLTFLNLIQKLGLKIWKISLQVLFLGGVLISNTSCGKGGYTTETADFPYLDINGEQISMTKSNLSQLIQIHELPYDSFISFPHDFKEKYSYILAQTQCESGYKSEFEIKTPSELPLIALMNLKSQDLLSENKKCSFQILSHHKETQKPTLLFPGSKAYSVLFKDQEQKTQTNETSNFSWNKVFTFTNSFRTPYLNQSNTKEIEALLLSLKEQVEEGKSANFDLEDGKVSIHCSHGSTFSYTYTEELSSYDAQKEGESCRLFTFSYHETIDGNLLELPHKYSNSFYKKFYAPHPPSSCRTGFVNSSISQSGPCVMY